MGVHCEQLGDLYSRLRMHIARHVTLFDPVRVKCEIPM